MGWTGWLVGQLISTTLVLGSLKRSGIVVVQPQAFKNENARVVFTKVVNIGEDMSELLERGYTSVYERIYPPQTKRSWFPEALRLWKAPQDSGPGRPAAGRLRTT